MIGPWLKKVLYLGVTIGHIQITEDYVLANIILSTPFSSMLHLLFRNLHIHRHQPLRFTFRALYFERLPIKNPL